MQQFSLVREVELDQAQVWQRLTTWSAHSAGVPFTKVTGTSDGLVAVTRIGPIVVRDSMELTVFDPPRQFVAVKTGSVVTGEIDARVEQTGSGSRVTWTASVGIAGAPRAADRLLVAAGKVMYGRLIDRLLQTS